jgi:hypothetical protein
MKRQERLVSWIVCLQVATQSPREIKGRGEIAVVSGRLGEKGFRVMWNKSFGINSKFSLYQVIIRN